MRETEANSGKKKKTPNLFSLVLKYAVFPKLSGDARSLSTFGHNRYFSDLLEEKKNETNSFPFLAFPEIEENI